jgi:hypothetical protein
MTAITFDTHKFVRRLKEAGLPEMQAEAIADAFRDAQGEADLATKQDIAELRGELGHEIELVRHEIALVRRDLRELESRLTIRLGAMLAVAVGAIAALVKLL